MITVKQLVAFLDNVVKDGKGDLPVYLVHPQTDTNAPLDRGDTLKANGVPVRFLLVPEAYQSIELPNIIKPN